MCYLYLFASAINHRADSVVVRTEVFVFCALMLDVMMNHYTYTSLAATSATCSDRYRGGGPSSSSSSPSMSSITRNNDTSSVTLVGFIYFFHSGDLHIISYYYIIQYSAPSTCIATRTCCDKPSNTSFVRYREPLLR